MDASFVEAALAYARRGWPVFPLHTVSAGLCSCGCAECGSAGKHPRTPHGHKDATTDEETIRTWWTQYSDANVAIVTGAMSGLGVLDVDPRHNGDDSLIALQRQYGTLPETVESLTGGGGRHLLFQYPGGGVKSRTIASGLDIKADGGYIVAPPSRHVSGRDYVWEVSSHPDDVPLAPMPVWLADLAGMQKRLEGTGAESFSQKIGEGRRNQILTSLAGSMRRRNMSRKALEAALLAENAARCEPPLTEEEVRRIAASVSQYPPAQSLIPDSRFPPLADRANRENPPYEQFRLTPIGDLLAEPEESVRWLIENMLPAGGISILGAKPKVGKSTLARNLVLAVARGDRFLDRATEKGPVVYLALEEKRAEVQRHFARMGAQEEPIHVHVGAAPEKALDALAEAIAKHKPILAIIDPLLKLVRLQNANDYAEVTHALEPLITLARTSGCHLFCVHHLGKGERTGGDALLGSTALFAAVDTLLIMKRHDQLRTIETAQRYGEDLLETVVALDPETGRTSSAGALATVQEEACMEEVLEAIGKEELTETDIRGKVGGNQTLVAKAIRRLVELGKLQRQGAGKRGDPYRYRRESEAG